MKVLGKIFLIISGVLFLVWGIIGLVEIFKDTGNVFGSKDVLLIISYFVSIVAGFIQIFAAIGAIISVFGSKRLSGVVGFFAFINLVFVVASLITTIILGAANGVIAIWLPSVSTATSILYILGWAFTRNR